MAKPETIQKKWYLIDADGQVLGRLASQLQVFAAKTSPSSLPTSTRATMW